ncbi:MAG TPA: hypothetical protein VFR58_05865 [Flavisolibacter sp.]|nr:hypothetical protein [Flavisolibacter sp.]
MKQVAFFPLIMCTVLSFFAWTRALGSNDVWRIIFASAGWLIFLMLTLVVARRRSRGEPK